jgi:hypothetical protein
MRSFVTRGAFLRHYPEAGSCGGHRSDGELILQPEGLAFMRVTRLIQHDQDVAVNLILDDRTPVHVFTISGDGTYLDQGINTPIGSVTIGSKVIGGGGEETAQPFDVTFSIHTDRYQYISTNSAAQHRPCCDQQLRLQDK